MIDSIQDKKRKREKEDNYVSIYKRVCLHIHENTRNELREEKLNYITLVKKKYIYI